MTSQTTMRVERVLPARAQLTVGEVDAILEAAYLATAADGKLTAEENEAFRAVAGHLRGIAAGVTKEVSDGDLKKLFERFSTRSDHAARLDRIASLRAQLGRDEVRELAYKVAFAIALCDLDTSDAEVEYDAELVEAFGLTEERADALADEVYGALDAEEAEEE
jgi:hypothetical protein